MEVTIEQLLYANYIKYDKMAILTQQAFVGSDATIVNVYIDMHSLLKNLYAEFYHNTTIKSYVVIAASFINLCAHIRAYFRSRHRVESRIYLVYGENRGEFNKKFYYDYLSTWNKTLNAHTEVTEFINANLGLIEMLCPYLNDIFFIKTDVEPGVAIYNRINKDELIPGLEKVPSIIITKDEKYLSQIPATKPNVVIYRVCKNRGEDISYYIASDNIWLYNTNSPEYYSRAKSLNPGLLSLFMAMTHVPSRDIKSSYNTPKAIAKLHELIQDGHLWNSYNFVASLQYAADQIQVNLKSRSGPAYDIISKFKAIDIIYQHAAYMETPESKNESYLIRKIDNDGVREINNQYFKDIPLDLDRL